MHTENSIVMRAPRRIIFETAADLSIWPVILPHYRWVKYHDQSPTRNIVTMAARRKRIPVRWTSEQVIDREKLEIRFRHLKAFTKGMTVVWTFSEHEDGVLVRICHDLESQVPVVGSLIADHVIGKFFISYIAGQTLTYMKRYVEGQAENRR